MAEVKESVTFRRAFTRGGTDYTVPALILLGFLVSLLVWSLTPDDYAFPKSVSDKFQFADWINQAEKWLQIYIKDFTRSVSQAVGWFLEKLELFLWFAPWPTIALVMALPALAYGGLRLAIFTLLGVMFWGAMGMWDPAMSTLALMTVSVILSVVIGVAVGVWSSQSDTVETVVKPILDTMQTMPAFVYLIPAIFFFGIGGPSATMAIIIYAMPPVVRLTNLGIRQVPATTIEAALSFGSTPRQVLWKVQIPQALPSIMLGINQTIMMALGLAVLATFIGAGGLGEEVWKALRKLKVGWSLESGLSIVFMAIIFDRLSLAMSKPAESGLMIDPSKITFRLLPSQWAYWRPAQVVEEAINHVWQAVAKAGNLIVHYVSLAFGAGLGLANRDAANTVVAWMRRHSFFVAGFLLILAIYAWDAWIAKIGSFPQAWEFTIRKPVDEAIDWLVVNPTFYAFTTGLRAFIYIYILNPLVQFFVGLPWWFVLVMFFVIGRASVGVGFAIATVLALLLTGIAGIWYITMYTLASTIASVTVCILFGLPLGVLAAYSKPVGAVVRPILDTMQTMPAFVYLIPVLMFFGGNPVTAIIATVIYAVPPMVRMTILGLEGLPREIDEVSNAFGSTTLQALIKVRLPMASPSIMLGVNQAVVMALAMQVITPLVAGLGLGKEVFHAMNLADTGRGLVAGTGIVLLAIVLDRLTQAWTRNQREALGL